MIWDSYSTCADYKHSTMPQILKNMGFTSTKAQLMTAPPYACGAISALLSSLLADKFTWRMPFIASGQALLIIAFAILFATAENIKDNVALCYFAVHVACIGVYPILPGCNAWTINNLAGPEKRAIGIATMICIGNMGGIVGSFIYQERKAQRIRLGLGLHCLLQQQAWCVHLHLNGYSGGSTRRMTKKQKTSGVRYTQRRS